MTTKEQRHIELVKSQPCCLCDAAGPSDAHHILEGRIPGRKSHDFCTIPLCKDCHQGEKRGAWSENYAKNNERE